MAWYVQLNIDRFICSVHRFLIDMADDDLQFCERISHIATGRLLPWTETLH